MTFESAENTITKDVQNGTAADLGIGSNYMAEAKVLMDSFK